MEKSSYVQVHVFASSLTNVVTLKFWKIFIQYQLLFSCFFSPFLFFIIFSDNLCYEKFEIFFLTIKVGNITLKKRVIITWRNSESLLFRYFSWNCWFNSLTYDVNKIRFIRRIFAQKMIESGRNNHWELTQQLPNLN